MIITFANQKGGCGKSSIALMLGSYLSNIKKCKVVGFDTDKQRSYYGRYNKDLNLRENPLYSVEYFETIDLIKHIRSGVLNNDTYYLIDTAGYLSKEAIALIYLSNKVIVPFNYSKVSMDSSSQFLDVLLNIENLEIRKRLLLVANDIGANVKTDTIEEYKTVLGKYTSRDCIIDNYFNSSVAIQRIDTLNVHNDIMKKYNPVLEEIYLNIKI